MEKAKPSRVRAVGRRYIAMGEKYAPRTNTRRRRCDGRCYVCPEVARWEEVLNRLLL